MPQVTEPVGGSDSVSYRTYDFLLMFRILFVSENFINSNTLVLMNMYL